MVYEGLCDLFGSVSDRKLCAEVCVWGRSLLSERRDSTWGFDDLVTVSVGPIFFDVWGSHSGIGASGFAGEAYF